MLLSAFPYTFLPLSSMLSSIILMDPVPFVFLFV